MPTSAAKGPAVVLSHGFLLDRSMFDAQGAALAPEYPVITWDQRGHGGAPASALANRRARTRRLARLSGIMADSGNR